MTKAQRRAQLLPNGRPKWIRAYDAGGTGDRYTVIFTGRYRHRTGGQFLVLGMSAHPFHPQGVGMHMSHAEQIDAPAGWAPAIGRRCHLGRRIPFDELPPDCQRLVLSDYLDLWQLEGARP